MTLTQLELLRVLQETQYNMSRAAQKMHIVQSAVSRQLILLEKELGSPLFQRQGKKLIGLTTLGEQVMAQVYAANQAKNNILNLAAEYREGEIGILHIATTHTQAKYFLTAPIQKFREKYPKIKIYIEQSSPEHLVEFLHSNRADIAICTEKVADDGSLVVKPCYKWHHAIVVQKDHPLASGPLSLERITDFPILTYSLGYTGRSAIEKAFHHNGLELDVVLAAADSDVIKTYVRLGLGVGLIADIAYDPEFDSDLVIRSLSELIAGSVTKIAYLQQHYLPNYAQHFIDELLTAADGFDA